MRSRLYLNLGLVYEMQDDLTSARKFMEKALSIVQYVTVALLAHVKLRIHSLLHQGARRLRDHLSVSL